MKFIRRTILLFSLLPVAALAQREAPDSLYTYAQDRNLLDEIEQNGAQLVSSTIKELSTAQLSYQTARGHFRTAQQAESGRIASFGTSGIATLGRFKLFGAFKFARSWQDSMAWNMKGVEEDKNPYYFAAGKAGKYQRINYQLNTTGTYRLPGDQWFVATGLDYFYNTAAGSVDPRASVQTFHLLVKPELIYQKGKQTFGLNFLWGYEHEDNGISYRNINYSSGQGYPDRILYQVFGYGSFAQAGNRSLRRKGDFLGAGLSYIYQDVSGYLRVRANYAEHNEDALYPLAGGGNYGRYGSFYLKTYSLNLLAGMNGEHHRHQLQGVLNYEPGADQNATLKASSYKYSGLSAFAAYRLQSKNISAVQTEIGINVLYYDQSQRDLSVSHIFGFSYVRPGLEGSVYKSFAHGDRLKLTLSPMLRLPLHDQLSIPESELNVIFNNNITYPDYAYQTSTVGILHAGAEWTTPHLLKGVYSSFAVNGDYYYPFKIGNENPSGVFKPSGHFLDLAFSFNIYF